MKKKFGILLISLICALALFGAYAFAAEPIKIGVLMPITGPSAAAGRSQVIACELIAEVINEKYTDLKIPLAATEGVLGRKVQIIKADHQGKPDVAKSEAERLVNQEKVFAIIGCYNSSATKPASAVTERAKKLFMCGASSSAALTERGFKYFFRHAPTDAVESLEFVDYLDYLNKEKGMNFKTVGLFYENSEFGKHAADEGKKACAAKGYKVVADVPFTVGATNMNSEVQTLKTANPDVIFGAAIGNDYVLWVRTMKQVNWLPKMVINYCTGYQAPPVQKELGRDGDYFMGGNAYSAEIGQKYMPEAYKFDLLFQKKAGIGIDSEALQEAAMINILCQAIEKAGALDTEKVRKLLETETFPSPLSLNGKVSFEPGGQNRLALSVITQLSNLNYETIYPLNFKSREPVLPIPGWGERK